MPMDVILEACDRTVEQTDKGRFKYADKIIISWHKSGILTMEAIEKADAEYKKSKEKTIIPIESAKHAKAKPNRFVNFNQRENDYAHYEQLERAYLAQKLKV